jgi:rhodanese-related sulfurtransferase
MKSGFVVIIVLVVLVLVLGFVYFNDGSDVVVDIDDEVVDGLEDSDRVIVDEVVVEKEFVGSYRGIYPIPAKDMIGEGGIVIIDVASEIKYNQRHISDAVNYPFGDDFESLISGLDKDKKYLIYSRSDINSKKVAQVFVDLKFKNIYYLKGSYGLWLDTFGS